MFCKKNNGQEALEFVLITVLIFFGAIFTIVVFADKIAAFFSSDSSAAVVSKKEINVLDASSQPRFSANYETIAANSEIISPGSLGGTVEEPAFDCDKTSCKVDFGTFTLSDVPLDLTQQIETSGSSGGTEIIVNLMDQLVIQSKEKHLSVAPSLLIELASYGHKLAYIEKQMEKEAQNFIDNPDKIVASEYKVGAAQLTFGADRALFEFNLKKINERLEKSSDPSDNNAREIINLLASEILTIADTMSADANSIPTGYDVSVEDVEKLLKPEASKYTDIKLEMICKTGHHKENREGCK